MDLPMQEVLENKIRDFPSVVHAELREILHMDRFDGVIRLGDAHNLSNLLEISVEQLMVEMLAFAKQYANPPISDFHVGAISQGLTGNLYFGANLEFDGNSLNATVHAEQAAVLNAWIHGEQGLRSLAVNGAPCGHCRQFLNELSSASTLRLLTPNADPLLLETLLPNAFGPHSLGNSGGLMQPEDHQLCLSNPSNDKLAQAALEMANMSYAPYSGNYAGIALLTESGQIYAAPYAENVAFNPSLSPIQGAMIHRTLSGQSHDTIQRAALVEVNTPHCSQIAACQAVLKELSPVDLVVEYAHSKEDS